MPRKPTDPRPDRCYIPLPADLPLDRLRSASAIVAPPGFGLVPVSLASLFADAGPATQALSFQVQTQTSALGEEPGAAAPQSVSYSLAAGGAWGEPSAGEVTLPAVSVALTSFGSAQSNSPSALESPDASDSGIGGGALRGRGGSGGLSRQPVSSGGAQPFSGGRGSGGYFGAGLFGNPGTNAAHTSGGAAGPANGSPASQAGPPQGPPAVGTQGAAPGAQGQSAVSATGATSSATASNETGRAGHATVQTFGPQNSSGASNRQPALGSISGSGLPSLTLGPPGSSSFGLGGAGQSGTASGVPGTKSPSQQSSSYPTFSGPTVAWSSTSGASTAGSTTSASASSRSSGLGSQPGAGGQSLAPASSSPTAGSITPDGGPGGGPSGAPGGEAAMLMPVGGGGGGIFAQAYRFQQAPPPAAPYSGGPVIEDSQAPPFITLNALILSYIDSALGSIVPFQNTPSPVITHPPSLSITASDGLGAYTFSASAEYEINTTHGHLALWGATVTATFDYTFQDTGYTPDGTSFAMSDSGGATLSLGSATGTGTTLTHPLSGTLDGSDSYAETQVLAQTDNIIADQSGETLSDTLGGSDSFSDTETQCETLNSGGTITAGWDTYVLNESGTDTSNISDVSSDNASTFGEVTSGGSSSSGGGSGGHTLDVTGTDTMASGGFLSGGSNQFTWGGSDSESTTTSESQTGEYDWPSVDQQGGYSVEETILSGESDTLLASESSGETGSERFASTEGTNFGWTETVGYGYTNSSTDSDPGGQSTSETESGESGLTDTGQDGESFSTSDNDHDSGNVCSTLTDTGSQTLNSSLFITGGASTVTWSQQISDTDTQTENESTSDASSDSATLGDSTDNSVTTSDNVTDTDSSSSTDNEVDSSSETDTGNESLGSFGLVFSGVVTVTVGGGATDNLNSTDTGGDSTTEIDSETDTESEGVDTDQDSDAETDQDDFSETGTDTSTIQTDTSTLTLGGGGMVVGSTSTQIAVNSDDSSSTETDTESDKGTDSDTLADEADTDSYSDDETDSVTVAGAGSDTPTDIESGTVTLGAGYTVIGGTDFSSFVDNGAVSSATTTETDSDNSSDSATDSMSEGGDSDSTSDSDSDSATDSSTETDIETASATDTTSLSLGSAGVVVSGTGFEFDSTVDNFTEDDSDTGGSTDQDADVTNENLGGNTTSDSLSTSDSDTGSGTGTDGGSAQSSATLYIGYGPGQLITDGTQFEGDTDTESPTETIRDTDDDSSKVSETDSDLEAANTATDTLSTTDSDTDSYCETDADSSSSGDQATVYLAPGGAVLNGFSTSSETDTGSDDSTDADTATTTDSDSDSYTDTLGDETTTDADASQPTDTDAVTDTEDDAVTSTEQSTDTTGPLGVVLGATSEQTVVETGTNAETVSDVDVDASTVTSSEVDDASADSDFNDEAPDTLRETDTLTGSSTEPYTVTESSTLSMTLGGVVTSGASGSEETDSGSGSWTSSTEGADTATTTLSDNELDTGDSSTLSESDVESGTYSASGSDTSSFDDFNSSTETVGDDGVVTGGSLTTSMSESSGATDSASETDGMSDSVATNTIDMDEDWDSDTEPEQDSGTYAVADSGSAGSTLIETLAETLGYDAVVASGDESQSLSDTSAETTTETEYPTETMSDSVSDVTTTVTMTASDTDTSAESDDDWATESLGTSGTISGGSDCFTISSSDDSTYDESGPTGRESSTDTDTGFMESDVGPGSGTEAITGASGASSSLYEQTIGDVLGQGGAIASGSLTYNDTTSSSGDQTKTESGTEDTTDELVQLPSVTASYSVTTTTSDHDSASESGTESLTQGGGVSGGSASFSWSDGDSINRRLGLTGLNADMNISDSSTDSYGFGESGTESITTGGVDTPGTVGYLWTQMGTDDYQIGQANEYVSTSTNGAETSVSYGLSFVDTVSSSWRDAGVDSLTSDDVLAGETDNWTWHDSDSLSECATEAFLQANGGGPETINARGDSAQAYSIGDAGSDTLGTVATDTGSMTLQAAGETYTIVQSSWGSAAYDGDVPSFSGGGAGSNLDDDYNSFSTSEVGWDGLSGSLSSASNSYLVDDYSDLIATDSESWDGNGGSTDAQGGELQDTFSVLLTGTNSIASSGATQSWVSYESNSLYTDGGGSESGNGESMVAGGNWFSDPYQFDETGMLSQSTSETGWYSETGGRTEASDSYTSQGDESAYVTGSDQDDGNWDSESWGSGSYSATGTEPLGGGWTNQTWSSTTSSSSTEGTMPAADFDDDNPAPAMSGGSLPEGDTNTFLKSVNAELSSGAGINAADIFYYNSSPWEFAYLGGTTIEDRATEGGPYMFQPQVDDSYGTAAPNSDSMTPNGLPGEEVTRLATFAANYSIPDGVSSTDPTDPTDNLVALAAAWRNPSDITIPVLAGSEGSGGAGGDARIVGGPGSTAAGSGGTSSGATSSGGAPSSSSGSGSSSPGAGGVEPLAGEGEQGSHLAGWAGTVQSWGATIWAYTGGALYNRYVANGAKVGAGVGAAQNFGSNMSIDMDQFRLQRDQLQKQIDDPSAQTASTETTVDQYQATNARNFQNFGQARVTDAAAVAEGADAAAGIGVDSYAIYTAPGAARALAGGIKAAAGGIKAAAVKVLAGRAAPGAATAEGAPVGAATGGGGVDALIDNPAHSATNLQRLNASLRLEQTLGNGRIIGPQAAAIEVGQTRIAVLDTQSGRIYYGPSPGGRHFDLVEGLGLPPAAEERYVGGFIRAGEDGRITFIHESGTYPPSGLPGVPPRRIDDFIRGAGANPIGGGGP